MNNDTAEREASVFDRNEYGLWCPSCGALLKAHWSFDETDDDAEPEDCRECGYPDEEEIAQYHAGDTQ